MALSEGEGIDLISEHLARVFGAREGGRPRGQPRATRVQRHRRHVCGNRDADEQSQTLAGDSSVALGGAAWLKAGEPSVVQGRSKLSSGLVIMQLTSSVLLLVAAGLAYRSLSQMGRLDLGYQTEQAAPRVGESRRQRQDTGGEASRIYRCAACRLELAFDMRANRMVVAADR